MFQGCTILGPSIVVHKHQCRVDRVRAPRLDSTASFCKIRIGHGVLYRVRARLNQGSHNYCKADFLNSIGRYC